MNRISKLMCFFGLHKWLITEILEDKLISDGNLISDDMYRICEHCGKLQKLDIHCLGLNPPEYIREWRNID